MSETMEVVQGICGRDGRATACVRGDGGSIPTCSALEVWPCDFGPKQFGWLNKSAGRALIVLQRKMSEFLEECNEVVAFSQHVNNQARRFSEVLDHGEF